MKLLLRLAKKSIRLISLLLLGACAVTALGFGYARDTFNEIKENVVRLHVIANSDSEEDQALKLKVRDKVIECVSSFEIDSESAGEYVSKICEKINLIKDEVTDYLQELGSDYDIEVTVGESSFPAKSYGDIVLPAGKYNAIRVTIGEGAGKNWWCVMFPPLCYTNNGTVLINDTENSLLKKTLPPEAYKTIKGTVKNTAEDTEKKTSAASDELTTYEVPESENTDAQSNVSLIADDGLISDNVEVNVRFKIVEVFQESGQKIERAWQNCKRLFFR